MPQEAVRASNKRVRSNNTAPLSRSNLLRAVASPHIIPETLALAPGTRLGAYQVLALIGAGGMGEVYRAKDTKLGREVAVKVLPEAFALDPDRVAARK